jgi:hypothetical protein
MHGNGTWEIPSGWQITNISGTVGHLHIVEIVIDNMTYFIEDSHACSDLRSRSFGLIFKLGTRNDITNFHFGWWNGDREWIAWLPPWFELSRARK